MQEVIFEVHSQAEDVALQCFSSQDTESRNKLKQSFQTLKNPFTSINSEIKLNKHLRERWGLVEPVQACCTWHKI